MRRLTKLGMSNVGMKRVAEEIGHKYATQDSDIWDMVGRCSDALGEAGLIDALIQAMSTEEARDNLDYIIKMHDIGYWDAE